MAAHKTSAVGDEPIEVLIALHPKFDLLDLTGPMKVFTTAAHNFSDECKYIHQLRLRRWSSILTPHSLRYSQQSL